MQKDEEFSQFSSDSFLSEDAPELTDSEVELFMSAPDHTPPGMAERVHAKFVAKILGDLHPDLIQQIKERWPLGRWIEAIRKKARFTRGDIGVAIGKDESFVEKIETGEILPWELSPRDVAAIARLFRLSKKAMRQLVEGSAAVHQAYDQGISVAARSHRGRWSKERKDTMRQALDLYLARNSGNVALDKTVLDWLDTLEEEIERH